MGRSPTRPLSKTAALPALAVSGPISLFWLGVATAGSGPADQHKEKEVLVGVNYFPGWWKPLPNKWHDGRGEDWRTRFRERVPLLGVKSGLDSGTNLGLPLPGGGRQKIFTIYAWNEFGEGGIVVPTRGEQSMKLEAIRAVFGTAP